MPRSRHFGANIPCARWEEISLSFAGGPFIVEGPAVSHPGEPTEQSKLMIAEPSGNLIEIKACRFPEKVLGGLARD